MSLRAQTVPRPISVCGLCTLDKPWLVSEEELEVGGCSILYND
jgi:hypothetical protein